VVLLLGTFGVSAEEKTLQFDDILQMLDSSEKQFSYLGTKFVIDYTPTRRSTTLVKVTYGAPGWQKKEVAPLQPGQSAQIILDDGKFLWHYIPSQASVVKKKQRMSLGRISKRIYSQNKLIQQNYDIHIEQQPQPSSDARSASSQVASVTGDVVVSFQPKAHDRPVWKLWIESEHGLIVRTEVYDIQGNLALLSAFSELTFQPKISTKAFVMTVPKGTTMRKSVEQHFQSIEEAQPEVSFPISEPAYMPPGFVLTSVIHSPTTKRGEKVQLAYIDGMSSISVFEEKRAVSLKNSEKTSKEVEINKTLKGTFHDHGLLKILRWQLEQDFYITLVGEVADTELLKIAASITK
jgi:outer membrane lipoprotein-sorting protein